VARALQYLDGHRALCAALEEQRALSDAPEEVDTRLRQLWRCLGGDDAYSRISEAWGRLGFQGRDPATDLRGGGGLALCDLLHLATSRPALCARMVERWSDPTSPQPPRSLPLALTALHASSWLYALLEDELLEQCLLARAGAPAQGAAGGGYADLLPSYRQLLVELFVGFDAEWTRRAPESIMQFEKVADEYVARVRKALERGCVLLTDV